jgi:CheY-like chemotaxis protein
VESESQLEFLGAQLCDVVQGYLFSAPLRATELSNFIRQHKRLVGPVATPSWNVERVAEANGRHVLVVDDDAAIRILVQKMLERARFNVDTARDGMEAISKIRENHYVAVFLDIMMPRLDGFGVIDYLKRETPELLKNVVVMTAISPAALQRVASEPVARILPKPFDVAQIIASANECALRQRAG